MIKHYPNALDYTWLVNVTDRDEVALFHFTPDDPEASAYGPADLARWNTLMAWLDRLNGGSTHYRYGQNWHDALADLVNHPHDQRSWFGLRKLSIEHLNLARAVLRRREVSRQLNEDLRAEGRIWNYSTFDGHGEGLEQLPELGKSRIEQIVKLDWRIKTDGSSGPSCSP